MTAAFSLKHLPGNRKCDRQYNSDDFCFVRTTELRYKPIIPRQNNWTPPKNNMTIINAVPPGQGLALESFLQKEPPPDNEINKISKGQNRTLSSKARKKTEINADPKKLLITLRLKTWNLDHLSARPDGAGGGIEHSLFEPDPAYQAAHKRLIFPELNQIINRAPGKQFKIPASTGK